MIVQAEVNSVKEEVRRLSKKKREDCLGGNEKIVKELSEKMIQKEMRRLLRRK